MYLNGFRIEDAIRKSTVKEIPVKRKFATAISLATIIAMLLAPIVEAGGKVFKNGG